MACHLTLNWHSSAEKTKKVLRICAVCAHFASHFAHISLLLFPSTVLLFYLTNKIPKTACKLHRKRQNRTALHTTTHHQICESVCAYVPLWYFINREKRKEKKEERESIKLLLRLWLLLCAGYVWMLANTYTHAHSTTLLISGCYFM